MLRRFMGGTPMLLTGKMPVLRRRLSMETNIALDPRRRRKKKAQERRELLCINTIRTLAMDAVQKADSGHPGTPMALAPLAYVLWDRYLRFNPRNSHWPGRDRFILSN